MKSRPRVTTRRLHIRLDISCMIIVFLCAPPLWTQFKDALGSQQQTSPATKEVSEDLIKLKVLVIIPCAVRMS